MRKKLLNILVVILLVLLSGPVRLLAQNAGDLRINEILVENTSNYIDDFGQHSPWIEIFNTAYNAVDVGGLYLTDDLSNPTKYRIPRGQQITLIPPRSYLVFWANNQPSHGIRHLNFTLSAGKTIALFDANGRTLIDSVSIPFSMVPDITFGRKEDGAVPWINLLKSTPGANNDPEFKPQAADKFLEIDPVGVGMSVVAMTVVFFALALLYVFFKNMSRFMKIGINKQMIARTITKARLGRETGQEAQVTEKDEDFHVTGEVNAAIAMALYLYSVELHDAESAILTINKVSRTYSPWSSKIYGLRKYPK